MEIILGKKAGFCFGVEKAVSKADKVISENKDFIIYCLGDLVHNRQVISTLTEKGIIFINDISEIKSEDLKTEKVKLIIRAHGIPKKVYEEAKRKNIEILDYTCPSVLLIHKMVEDFAKKGYYVLLIAEKNHPETIGTYSFTNGHGILLEREEEIQEIVESIKSKNVKKLFVVAQTTFNLERFLLYVEKIKKKLEKEDIELEIKNTICNATKLRQNETEKLSAGVDAMIVIGGKKSSNSTKLYEISKKNCKDTFFIEACDELKERKEEIKKLKKIGIMAGASTPQKSIDDVIKYIKTINR